MNYALLYWQMNNCYPLPILLSAKNKIWKICLLVVDLDYTIIVMLKIGYLALPLFRCNVLINEWNNSMIYVSSIF